MALFLAISPVIFTLFPSWAISKVAYVLTSLDADTRMATAATMAIRATIWNFLAKKIVKGGLSVRATEALVSKKPSSPKPAKMRLTAQEEKDADTIALEGDLSANIGMVVRLNHTPGQEKGSVTIEYENLDQLDSLCRILSGS